MSKVEVGGFSRLKPVFSRFHLCTFATALSKDTRYKVLFNLIFIIYKSESMEIFKPQPWWAQTWQMKITKYQLPNSFITNKYQISNTKLPNTKVKVKRSKAKRSNNPTLVSADHDPPMFEVSGGITPRALASSNSLGEEVENVCQYYVVVVVGIK